ncbi:MAG: acyltransferase family protein [Acidimicrobiales bacterium]
MALADARASTVAPAPPNLDEARTHTYGSGPDDPGGSGTTTAASPGPASSSKLPYFPGLDGLRGIAVIAVLFFHGGFSWAVGGYLGVSTFFTLSGFLITSLLLAERTTTRTVDLRAFWGRRLRRLMPASFAALAVVLAFGAVAASAAQQRNLGGDVTAALLYVANWRFIISGQSYADLFAAPSPVLHFWSLAIEEQFYLIYPLVAFVLLGRLKWDRWKFGRALMVLMACSLAATLFLGYSHDRIYYGTDTRAFELLAGGVLGVLIYSRRVTRRLARPGQHRTTTAVLGGISLAICAWLWTHTAQSSDWLYHGGLAAYSLLSCAVILATIIPYGPVSRLMALSGLRRVGELSYGIYVFHWPIFLWLDGDRTGLSIWPLFLLRIAVTTAVALLSYHYLEQPIRRRKLTIGGRSPLVVAPAVAVLLALGAWTITAGAPKPISDFTDAEKTLQSLGSGSTTPITGPDGNPLPLQPAKVSMYGDSTAVVVGVGLADVDQEKNLIQSVDGGAWLGCGLGRGGQLRSTDKPVILRLTLPACNRWADTYTQVLDRVHPDLNVVLDAPWDVSDRKIPGDDTWRGFGDPVYDDFFRHEMLDAVDLLSSQGGTVVWLTTPPVSNRPDRTDRLNQMIEELPQLRPGKVEVVDLAGYLAQVDPDGKMRKDHIHLTPEAARDVARDFLIPELDKIWQRVGPARMATTTTTTPPS